MTAVRRHAMSAPTAEHRAPRSRWVGGIVSCARGIDARRSASSSATARIERVSCTPSRSPGRFATPGFAAKSLTSSACGLSER